MLYRGLKVQVRCRLDITSIETLGCFLLNCLDHIFYTVVSPLRLGRKVFMSKSHGVWEDMWMIEAHRLTCEYGDLAESNLSFAIHCSKL